MSCAPRIAAALIAATCTPDLARAAGADPLFNIRESDLNRALMSLAIQAGVSISLDEAKGCRAPGPSILRGRFSAAAALSRLLRDSGCEAVAVDERAFIIRRTKAFRPVAEPPPPRPEAPLSPVVVVATRRAAAADRLAGGVAVETASELANLHRTSLTALTLDTASVAATNLGPGRDKVFIRGLSDGALVGRAQALVGLYIDGVRLTFAEPDPDLRLTDYKAVEVLRGPQGALYGSGSMGGVIDLRPNAPDPRRRSVSASLGASLADGGAAKSTVDLVTNVPLGLAEGAVRGVIYDEGTPGYIDNPRLGARRTNAVERRGGRLAASVQTAPGAVLELGALTQEIHARDSQYALVGAPGFSKSTAILEPYDNDFTEAHASLKWALGGGTLTATAASVQHSLSNRYDASASSLAAGLGGPAAMRQTTDTTSVLAEAVYLSSAERPLVWMLGAFSARTWQATRASLATVAAPQTPRLEETRHERIDEVALFGEATLHLGSRTALSVGGRLFEANAAASFAMAAGPGAPLAPLPAARHTGFAPRLSLSYAPDRNSLVYLLAAEGYRPGGVNTFHGPQESFASAVSPGPPQRFLADEMWSYEAGVKTAAPALGVRFRAAAFYAQWKNLQSDQLLPSGLLYTANLGDASNLGLEFEAAANLGPLLLKAHGLVDDPEVRRFMPGGATRPDLALAAAAKESFGGSLSYTHRLAAGGRVEVDASWNLVGSSRLPLSPFVDPKTAAYQTLRLDLGYEAGAMRLFLSVDNLTDNRADTFALGNPFSVGTSRQWTPLRPRTLLMGVSFAY